MDYIISKFSHELKNPLASLYGTVQLLEMQHPEIKTFKYWSNLRCDIEYMNRLIDEFSDLSKSECLRLSAFSLRSLLEQISLSFAASIAESKVEYTSKISASINQITGDKTKLQEVFSNLLKNAFDATKPDKSIYLEAMETASHIQISIRDNGCGISKEKLPTIFEPFVTYKKDGTGLGLSICREIVEAHGGTISVESTLHEGTCFTILLPKTLCLL